jgi:hypothetical protein
MLAFRVRELALRYIRCFPVLIVPCWHGHGGGELGSGHKGKEHWNIETHDDSLKYVDEDRSRELET